MRPDQEELLRRAAGGLAGPSASATRVARQVALEAVLRPAVRRRRTLLATVAAVLVATAGVAAGSIALPDRGIAGSSPVLGFLPAQGWNVLQAGGTARPERPGLAIAANVPLHPLDDAAGLPYSTLRVLGPRGVVLVATFVRQVDADGRPLRVGTGLPLRLRAATGEGLFGADVRPERPLGQAQLRGLVEGYWVDVQAYFGARRPSPALLDEAQRQLDRLVVSPGGERGDAPARRERAGTVTIAFQRYWYPPGNYFQMRFFGTISSGQAGEYVSVLKKECGASYSTAIAGALTMPGGSWDAVPDRPAGGGEFRARWNDELSEPVTYRQPLVPWLEKVGRGRFRATVTTYTPPGGTPQNMRGRRIDLQRLSAGQWTRMRSAELVRTKRSTDNFFHTFVATFPVSTKGLRLRAYVPAKSALPCFAAGASKPLRS